ncbi:hypothetical protein [Variovorax sp. JS1663]|uniref:hypothetical protein n=1 Tax=Variovorax sp. JS1663 TaxID=1851577 RepID=UPI000B345076|nr:hypothetical protein [Variovorax sp. JS1663]OUM00116.1 hypothetical protein A8M77_23325 [Variovorax sp. JS1663]
MTATTIGQGSSSEQVAFGSLLDLAMLRTGAVSAEVCEVCSTINLGSAHFCKGCNHKLPAYYVADLDDASVTKPGTGLARHGWARAWDLAAFWVVINSLAGATMLVPFVS